MAVQSMPGILRPAFEQRYGVGAFNVVNDGTMKAVLDAAEECQSPVIIQVSVKTVKVWGAKLMQLMFQDMASRISVPATLHLDHCPYMDMIEECLDAGWNSVLFDGSGLGYDECLEQTKLAVAMAKKHGAGVEGELEAVMGVEDGIGSEEQSPIVPLDDAVRFVRETGIDLFAPAIGTAHGMYHGEPKIDFDRISEIVAEEPIPLVLHGGTGLSNEVFRDLIARGTAKVNISTHLKITFTDSSLEYLKANPTAHDPLKFIAASYDAVKAMAMDYMKVFGSVGKAT